jgi:hypothetical protein
MSGTWFRRPSPALVIAVLALVVAMAGTGYAAFKLPKNSVGTRQLKKNAVTGAKVAKASLTGQDIDLAQLGTVPAATNAAHAASADSAAQATSALNAGHANTADSANSIPPAGPIHFVGTPGEPPFLSGSANHPLPVPGGNYQRVGFYKDHEGVVHLEGVVDAGKEGATPGLIFVLPPGYRPADGTALPFEPAEERGILVNGAGVTLGGFDLGGAVYAAETEKGSIPLGGITFLAQG